MMNQDKSRRQWNYELLGAPALLYRNEASYTELDLPAQSVTPHAFQALQAKKRARARWYYPIDFHRVKQATGDASDNDEHYLPVAHRTAFFGQKRRRKEMDQTAIAEEHAAKLQKKKEMLKVARRIEIEQNKLLRDKNFLSEQNLDLQQEARRILLRDHDKEAAKSIVWSYQHSDSNVYPAKIRFHGAKNNNASFRFADFQEERLGRFTKERINHADPAYLAPFQQSSWMENSQLVGTAKYVREESNTSSANEYGNCIVSFPCTCAVCRKGTSPTFWVLHPVGPLLETIQLSYFATPGGRKVCPNMKFTGGLLADGSGKMVAANKPRLLDTGDTVREILKCGDNLFATRGTCCFTIFRIQYAELAKISPNDALCLGGAQILVLVDRVDLRSFIRGALSYRPRNMTAHPSYGGALSDARVAVVYELENRDVSNSIRQYNIGEEIRSTEHMIACLQYISDLQYSSFHPMVLWASARSYVRPLPTYNHLRGFPRVGFGTALFAVDLRSDKATFQWSPSAEEFVTEGTHSVSNILTDWRQDNTVFVSSISSKKTWELDMRMPSRSVTSWSLPHFAEGTGAGSQHFGCFGAGMLFEKPSVIRGYEHGAPLFAVNKTPGSAGIHLYQRPNRVPAFQCPPMESVFTPEVNVSDACVATSMFFPLPDVAGPVFTCGLTSIRIPTPELFASVEGNSAEKRIVKHAPSTICLVSSTNKGDLYVHCLLESDSEESLSKASDSLPLGGASVPIPQENPLPNPEIPFSSLFNCLPLSLKNEYPVSSSAIIVPLKHTGRSKWHPNHHWDPQFRELDSPVEVTPNGTHSLSLSAGAGHSVQLESNLLESQKEAFFTTMNCFNDDLPRAQKQHIRRTKDIDRTDLTDTVIQDAERDWNNGYTSEQSIGSPQFL